MTESERDRSGSPGEEITNALAVTDPYPKDGPPQLKLETVTGEYPAGTKEELLRAMQAGVPSDPMIDDQTIPGELTSADIVVLHAAEVAALPSIPSESAQEGAPVDKIHELTTQQLADAVVSGAVPTRMITVVTTELLSAGQVETTFAEDELQAKIQTAFNREINTYLGEFNEGLLSILQGVRDKVCEKFKGITVEDSDILVEALNIQLVVEAVMTQQFSKLINQGYLSARASE